ncbi:hypothetical protein BKA69DRAFT_346889 [Paraphysoderma sedebokerense]|nr:hypothetical protein BKA69DRAFT_346889 [Paraphysoderma sedebokerense]
MLLPLANLIESFPIVNTQPLSPPPIHKIAFPSSCSVSSVKPSRSISNPQFSRPIQISKQQNQLLEKKIGELIVSLNKFNKCVAQLKKENDFMLKVIRRYENAHRRGWRYWGKLKEIRRLVMRILAFDVQKTAKDMIQEYTTSPLKSKISTNVTMDFIINEEYLCFVMLKFLQYLIINDKLIKRLYSSFHAIQLQLRQNLFIPLMITLLSCVARIHAISLFGFNCVAAMYAIVKEIQEVSSVLQIKHDAGVSMAPEREGNDEAWVDYPQIAKFLPEEIELKPSGGVYEMDTMSLEMQAAQLQSGVKAELDMSQSEHLGELIQRSHQLTEVEGVMNDDTTHFQDNEINGDIPLLANLPNYMTVGLTNQDDIMEQSDEEISSMPPSNGSPPITRKQNDELEPEPALDFFNTLEAAPPSNELMSAITPTKSDTRKESQYSVVESSISQSVLNSRKNKIAATSISRQGLISEKLNIQVEKQSEIGTKQVDADVDIDVIFGKVSKVKKAVERVTGVDAASPNQGKKKKGKGVVSVPDVQITCSSSSQTSSVKESKKRKQTDFIEDLFGKVSSGGNASKKERKKEKKVKK